jgi:hypothetical protein
MCLTEKKTEQEGTGVVFLPAVFQVRIASAKRPPNRLAAG